MRVLIVTCAPKSPISRIVTEMAQRSFVRLHIDIAPSVEEAIVHLQDNDYQTILLDLASIAPGGDMEPLHRLHGLRPDTPIVVLYGAHGTGLAALALRIGAVDAVNAADLDVRGLWRAVYVAALRCNQREAHHEVAEALEVLVGNLRDLSDYVIALRDRIDCLDKLLTQAIHIVEGLEDGED